MRKFDLVMGILWLILSIWKAIAGNLDNIHLTLLIALLHFRLLDDR